MHSLQKHYQLRMFKDQKNEICT